MDIFANIKKIPSVERVNNLYGNIIRERINFLFFVCPARKDKQFRLSRNGNYFIPDYKEDGLLSSSAMDRVERVEKFLEEFAELDLNCSCTCVFAAADSLICFPVFDRVPICPGFIHSFPIVSNYSLVRDSLDMFGRLYLQQPWISVPEKIRNKEFQRLRQIISNDCPDNVRIDLIERVWAGFALDGWLIRNGAFGRNPVILGVESAGVTMLQNAGLERNEWIPSIQLK